MMTLRMHVHKLLLHIPGKFLFFAGILMLLSQCEDPAKSEARRKEAAQALNNREIKRVTEDQLLELAMSEGVTITRIAQKALSRAVNQKISQKELNSADEFYKINSLPVLDSLEKSFEAKIQFHSFQAPQESKPLPEQQKILEKYQNDELPLEPHSESLLEKELLFTSPIILDAKPRGMWSVIFSRKYLVYKMNVKAFH
ncbi:MAG: hypothetical protein NW226_03605 [Microscillaceae bacterium]|nr:hypothetical protein [Microscillaceae bacterium]